MVSHPETGSDSPIGSDRDRGRDSTPMAWPWPPIFLNYSLPLKELFKPFSSFLQETSSYVKET